MADLVSALFLIVSKFNGDHTHVKIVYVVITFVTIGLIALYLWSGDSEHTVATAPIVSVDTKRSIEPGVSARVETTVKMPGVKSSTANSTSSSLSTELRRWNESHGYLHDPESNNPYSGYKFSQLMELAEQGDIEAIYQVSGSTILYDKDYEKGLSLLTDAAVRGSTLALVRTGNHYTNGQLPTAVEGQDNNLLAATYYMAADLRGDSTGTVMVDIALQKAGIDTANKAEFDSVCKAATDLLASLSEQRSQLGLGDFDNSRKPGDESGYHPICSR